MNRLVFPAHGLYGLRCALLAHNPNEAAAVLLTGSAAQGDNHRLLVREQFVVPPEGYIIQEPQRLSIKPQFLVPIVKRARNEGWSILLAHSHPFDHARVRFSLSDDHGEDVIMPALFGRAPERPHGALVLGTAGCDARVRSALGERPMKIDKVVESGSEIHFCLPDGVEGFENTVAPEFDRSVRAFGREGQATLAALTVGIVGVGGIGSMVAEQLAYLGVGRIILLDHDVVEASNLNRLVGAGARSVGRRKVTVARQHIRRIRASTKVDAVFGSVLNVRHARLLLPADLIFCCTDSHGSRAVLNQLAYQFMIPVFDLGIAIDARGGKVSHVSGRAQMLAPGLPCLTCQGLLDAEEVRRDLLTEEERSRDPYIMGAHEAQPAVISLNGTIASLGVTMMLAAVTGLPFAPRYVVLIGERGVVRAVESTCQPECVVCSLQGSFGRGDLWPLPGRP